MLSTSSIVFPWRRAGTLTSDRTGKTKGIIDKQDDLGFGKLQVALKKVVENIHGIVSLRISKISSKVAFQIGELHRNGKMTAGRMTSAILTFPTGRIPNGDVLAGQGNIISGNICGGKIQEDRADPV